MKQKIGFTIAAVLIFLIMVIALTPASFVVRMLSKIAPDIEMSGTSGSIWNGQTHYLKVRRIQMNDVQWRISPWALFTGRLSATVQFGGNKAFRGSAHIHASANEQVLENVELKVPAFRFAELANIPGVQLQGEVYFLADKIGVSGQKLSQLDGRVQWNQAVVQTPLGQPPLGSYAVDFRTESPGIISGKVQDLEGVLDLQGEVRLANNLMNLHANTRSDLPEQLDRFFRAVGRLENGRYYISFERPLSTP